MLPEDSVLVGVIGRKRDLTIAREQRWYRIPQARMPRGVTAEYLAFFLGGKSFGENSGAIHYYAKRVGLELHYRYELLPDEADHKRANEVYYQVQLGELQVKTPPIVNSTKRRFAFIYTTWDRFVTARTLVDLYSKNDFFVDRIYYALNKRGVEGFRSWEAEQKLDSFAPAIHILCENGFSVIASPERRDGAFYLNDSLPEDETLKAILDEITRNGGPVTISVPPGD